MKKEAKKLKIKDVPILNDTYKEYDNIGDR